MLPIELDGMPVVGAGGYLGAMTSTWLLEHFAPAGAWILTLTVLAVGLLLTTDYALLVCGQGDCSHRGQGFTIAGCSEPRGVLPTARRRRRPFTDLEEPITIEGDDTEQRNEQTAEATSAERGPKIKFRRPKSSESTILRAHPCTGPPTESGGTRGVRRRRSSIWRTKTGKKRTKKSPKHPTRELQVDDETVQLRNDEPHSSSPSPRSCPETQVQNRSASGACSTT